MYNTEKHNILEHTRFFKSFSDRVTTKYTRTAFASIGPNNSEKPIEANHILAYKSKEIN